MFASDRIFWSCALMQPVIGNKQDEEVSTECRRSGRVPGSFRSTTAVVRI
jgi:hypothetical protein